LNLPKGAVPVLGDIYCGRFLVPLLVPVYEHHDVGILLLKRGNKVVAEASYNQGGGFNFCKWGSTESKMAPIIDQMLTGVKN